MIRRDNRSDDFGSRRKRADPGKDADSHHRTADAAEAVLDAHPETRQRVEAVLELADGFETPYGLELLACVHWISHEDLEVVLDLDRVVRDAQAWTTREGELFTSVHIQRAWRALRDGGWIKTPSLV